MPLVPFGAIVSLPLNIKSPKWGRTRIIEKRAFGDVDSRVAFLAPDELSLVYGSSNPVGCCGPSAYTSTPEFLNCTCNTGLAWIEWDCIGPVNFVRLNLDRVHIEQVQAVWPPVMVESEFDSFLFNVAYSTVFSGVDRAWQLWEVFQLMDQGSAFDTTEGVFWSWTSLPTHCVRIYPGKRPHDWDPEDQILPPHLREVPKVVWSEHMRCALTRRMGMPPNPETLS